MIFNEKNLMAWNSTPETVPGYLGGFKVSESAARRTTIEPHDDLMIANAMEDRTKVESLVREHHEYPQFLEVANAVLGQAAVTKILNG